MRRLEQFARRFAAQNILARGCDQLVGRVGLAAFELARRQRALKPLDMREHVFLQPLQIKLMRLEDISCPGKLFLPLAHRGSTKKSGASCIDGSTA